MPVGRILLKSISSSRKLALLKTDGARLLYTWLIPHLNINGCYEADPLVIRSHILSRLDKTVEEIGDYLNDMEKVGLIKRYNINEDIYLFMPDFKEKQPNLRPEREGKTHIPIPTPDQLLQNSNTTPAQVKLSKVKLSKEQPYWAGFSKETQEKLTSILTDFPIYKFLGKLSKNKIKLPEEVIICICNSYLKNKSGIKDKWAWFMRTAQECWKTYNAQKNIIDSKELNKLSDCKEIKDLIKGILPMARGK